MNDREWGFCCRGIIRILQFAPNSTQIRLWLILSDHGDKRSQKRRIRLMKESNCTYWWAVLCSIQVCFIGYLRIRIELLANRLVFIGTGEAEAILSAPVPILVANYFSVYQSHSSVRFESGSRLSWTEAGYSLKPVWLKWFFLDRFQSWVRGAFQRADCFHLLSFNQVEIVIKWIWSIRWNWLG
jgi:hypothetical protein